MIRQPAPGPFRIDLLPLPDGLTRIVVTVGYVVFEVRAEGTWDYFRAARLWAEQRWRFRPAANKGKIAA